MKLRVLGVQAAALVGLGLLWATATSGSSPKLKGVEVLHATDGVRVVLDVESQVTHRSFVLPNPDRIVVDLTGAVNAVAVSNREFDNGPVSRLRVSQFKSTPNPVVRVVADLRTKLPHTVETQDEDVVLVVGAAEVAAVTPVAAATAAEAATATNASDAVGAPSTDVPAGLETPTYIPFGSPNVPATAVAPDAQTSAVPVQVESPVAQSAAVVEAPVAVVEPAVMTPAPVLQDEQPQVATAFSGAQSSAPAVVWPEDASPEAPPGGVELKPANGRRINLDVQGADIHVVLRTLSDYSGKNIIASREVEGEVTARLYDIPWEDALASVLKAHGYGYVEENGIIRVGVSQKIRNEELEEAAADRKREDLLPIETQVVRLQFADANELKPSLADMLSGRGKLQVDARTNALIVSDIPDYVAKIAAMAQDLDGRTPQVEIVSKLVDVSADDSRNLGINWGAVNISPNGSPIIGQADVTAPTTGAVGRLSLGSVQSWGALNATLDALEKKKKANVVSNPTITTVDNRQAKILVGAKIPLIVADQAGNAITQLTKIGIQMHVTPHINSDKTITMDMHTEVSELSSQATVQGGVIIQTSEADTRVLVENSETAIIGGLVRNVDSETKTGIPVLQDIPLLGALFRNTNKVNDKRELIIFVTPRILEAGTSGRGPRPD
jgi:hypothetical protein